MHGLILGLSNGTACLSTCAPVMLPYLLHGGKSVKQNYMCLLRFLFGRLAGYICASIVAWLLGRAFLHDIAVRSWTLAISYILLSATLVLYSLKQRKHKCSFLCMDRLLLGFVNRQSVFYPVLLGFLTGVNICPPFLIAIAEAASASGILESILFFAMFFIGTSVFFLPLPFLGLLRKSEALKTIGLLTLFIIALYYLLRGLIILGGMIYG